MTADDDLGRVGFGGPGQPPVCLPARRHHVGKVVDVADRQTQRVHFRQLPVAVSQRDPLPEPLERLVDRPHPFPLPVVSGRSLLDTLDRVFG